MSRKKGITTLKKIRANQTKKLLIEIFKSNERIFEQQQKLVDRYQELSETQENYERLNRTTRRIAFAFIIVRIIIYMIENTKKLKNNLKIDFTELQKLKIQSKNF